MDLSDGIDLPESAPATRGSKRLAVSSGSGGGQQQKIMEVMMKLLLSVSLRTRILTAVCLQVYRVEASCPFLLAMKEATTRFAALNKGLREKGKSPDDCRDQLGLPCIHAFNALLTTWINGLASNLMEAAQKAVQCWTTEANWLGMFLWHWVHSHVKLCRFEKMWDQKYKNLVLHVTKEMDPPSDYSLLTPSTAWVLIRIEILKLPNSRQLPGIPPSGDIERQVQEWLDENTKD